ncbi:hypothetical protein [Rhodopirellula sp. MGV]|uniref:hypothetical protein n=1 Tax=Rhodopirellula sp. MGV TaxID=2023130 RepID=UPI000B97A80F|nr:hypothetical protein [Rhodopirellula sp. MGV]OYP35385.1 hypothetical protein CGZ80_12000 [Rhodopirellula sp. MGV]PNY36312.1 hypothetical protein C2E31_13540 [Rhodopirellula baltica]
MQGKQSKNEVRPTKSVSALENEILNSLTADRKSQDKTANVFPADFSASGTGKGTGGNTGAIE